MNHFNSSRMACAAHRVKAAFRSPVPAMLARFIPLFMAALLLSGGVFVRPALADQNSQLLSLVNQMESSYAQVKDYTATFLKKERYADKQLPEERMQFKFQKPFKVYLKWVDGQKKEAIYVNGENSNKVVAHCEGVLGFKNWTFYPTDATLMKNNRHPITDIGFGFIIDIMRKNIPAAITSSEIEIVRLADEDFNGRPATVIDAKFSPRDGRKYYTAHVICHVDKEYMLPVAVACYDENEVLQEQYSYQDVKLNAGLSEMDFSKQNCEYRFN